MRCKIIWPMLVMAACGCTGAGSQLANCQAEKEQLLTTIRGQRETARSLEHQVASLENRLDQSEKELARRGADIRLSSRPAEPTSAPAAPLATPPAKTAPRPSDVLPWRAPAGKTEQKQSANEKSQSAASLLALARQDRRVKYDADSQAARVDVPIAFSEQSATLTGEDKKQLDEVARMLKSSEARELRIMVAGHSSGRPSAADSKSEADRFASARQLGTARAQAVADYLDRHGIAQERLAVSATGVAAANGAASAPVEIFLLDRNAPVVGWEPGKAVRR